MNKNDIIRDFNPNDPAQEAAEIFGLPFGADLADIVLVPVPWEATVSYGAGTSRGPAAILEASRQIDLNHFDYPDLWRRGIVMDEIPAEIQLLGDQAKAAAAGIIQALEEGRDPRQEADLAAAYRFVDEACESMNGWVEQRTGHWRGAGKIVGVVGGDHSSPLGHLRQVAREHAAFGVLMLDAHLDLRQAYEGFTYSHASIFRNALQLPQLTRLVQVGIRDFCAEEVAFAAAQGGRVRIHHDRRLQRDLMDGRTWKSLCEAIIDQLPTKVYVSVDIDGLDPTLCPDTGTPVPGGLSFEQAAYLLHLLGQSGKLIIGFDLCEVSPGQNDWNGNVGARVLYQLCGLAAG